MLFNSITFFIFFSIFLILYWGFAKKNLKLQNFMILIASYVFYGWWDWRFLSLIILSSIIDYAAGIKIHNSFDQSGKRRYLFISLLVNLGALGLFKYFNFFIESWNESWQMFGIQMSLPVMQIILPVGISFYTFQTLSYTIDIYRKKLQPTKNIIAFFAFVSFFPQLVAGPIERASHLLPQFFKKRMINKDVLKKGLKRILWGLFKKVVVADNMALFVDPVFNNPGYYSGLTTLLAVFFFAIQIYCDFSGYSDIAIGSSRILGFRLMINFNIPYFSASIKEFWSKWHISLSTWFRDYVYIPLGGSKVSIGVWQRNLIITFIVSGFWHGANWTFLIWGGIHGLFNSIEALFGKINLFKKLNFGFIAYIYTFLVVCFGWVFFRANSFNDAIVVINNILQCDLYMDRVINPYSFTVIVISFVILFVFEIVTKNDYMMNVYKNHRWLRWMSYYIMIISIILFGQVSSSEFIYFQF
ncbi:MAG: MBOAT family protein [Calditrichaeota bacterium]|nr:MAG: MBOAT family protein [Calditrichota bacterium]MBL1203792.1 MBOAT family protein [Calditrichota bacterium]NOG43622.1 MBOAT family protein [Calditrichota bacterium]